MNNIDQLTARAVGCVQRDRLVETARALCAVYSPTGSAGEVSDTLAEILSSDGFRVERPEGGHPQAPAVVVRFDSGKPGRTLQFDGHLDTVHLPFVPPAIAEGKLTGSGSSDMKAGVAAAVEALRALRDSEALPGGGILLVAHDLHEAPWGNGAQLNALIRAGIHGDAVLIPESLRDHLPVLGRGQAVMKIAIRRGGPPVHEVQRPADEPNVIAAGAELVARLMRLDAELSKNVAPHAGRESVFIGQIHSGEIYNQYPQECRLEGTRRWLPGKSYEEIKRQYHAMLDELARDTRTEVRRELMLVRDAFHLNLDDPLVSAFQSAMAVEGGGALPIGGKAFVDDGSSFWAIASLAAITHGPRAAGAHTLEEWVSIDDLVRVARVYAATAIRYCPT